MAIDYRNREFNARQHANAMERARRALRLYRDGLSWAEVGRELGVTRQRAQQLGARAAAASE